MRVGRQLKENIYLKNDFESYLQGKNLAPITVACYLKDVGVFLAWVDKEEIQIAKPDVLKYLEYLKNNRNLENISRSRVLNSLNHYFTFLLEQEQISVNPCLLLKIRGTQKKSLLRLYTPEELTQLYDTYYQLLVRSYDDSHIPKNQQRQSALSKQRNAVILNILIHQGTTTKEIGNMLLQDLDLMNATLKIRSGSKSNGRILPLAAPQIGVLMHYLQTIRPQFLEYQTQESERLFLTLPEYSKSRTNSTSIKQLFSPFVKQLKTIDRHFLSFKQIRISVITHWIKSHGLRKTQVMAGHRHIISTERYLANDLQQLSDDINKLHPF